MGFQRTMDKAIKAIDAARYSVQYAKTVGLTKYFNDYESAIQFARRMERAGYTVSVYEHTASGAKKVD